MKKTISVLLSVVLTVCALLPALAVISLAAEYVYTEFPEYDGSAYIEFNDDIPSFTASECEVTSSFETYGELDDLGRCTCAYACVGQDLMPTEERGSIGSVTPTGWQSTQYDNVPAKYLYNRCHLIGWQLTAENANRQNLITGTRYLNIDGMLSFEDEVAAYVKSTGNHVLYRVTPVFEGNELVARGVVMEGYSVEDDGEGICFNVYCYNVQPGIMINYTDGTSMEETPWKTYTYTESVCFVLNTGTMKFHVPTCSSAQTMSEENRAESSLSAAGLIEAGYSPCGRCSPEKAVGKSTVWFYGDTDLDGSITPADARQALRFSVKLDEGTELQLILCDVDGTDGISPADSRIILRAATGLQIIE